MPIKPESALQVMIHKWVRECVPEPHWFFSTDRAKAAGPHTHLHEKNRGVRAGQPDTHLLVPGRSLIAIELKSPGNKPTALQFEVGERIKAAGGIWGWCDSVAGYCALLRSAGVPLGWRAEFWAESHDATLAGAVIRREEGKTGTVSKKRFAAQPSAARVRKSHALRLKLKGHL